MSKNKGSESTIRGKAFAPTQQRKTETLIYAPFGVKMSPVTCASKQISSGAKATK
jgi:hypothetical protein